MIHKRFIPSSWFRDIPTAHLLKVHSRGVDFQQALFLQKNASSDMVMNIDVTPEKGYSFVHLITMGAGEYYGANNNADWFNEKTSSYEIPEHHTDGKPRIIQLDGGLEKFHSTFMKYGAVYREHNNSKKGGPELGSIRAEWYNPAMHRGELVVKLPNHLWGGALDKLANGGSITWSMGCFAPGALVTMDDHSQVPIEDVSVGQCIRMHNGESSEVVGTRKLDYEDVPIFTIRPSGGVPFECTPNHPFFVLRRDKVMTGRRFSYEGSVEEDGEWVQAEDLEEGDYMINPLHREVMEPSFVSKAFSRFCGYYLAEGYVMYNKKSEPAGICFTCHADDALLRNIYGICREIGSRNEPVESRRTNSDKAFSVEVYDKDLAEKMLLLFGSGALSKFLHPQLFKWSDDSLWNMLGAYHEGDGGFYMKSGVVDRGNAYFSTGSKELAIQIQTLSAMLGSPMSIDNITHCTSKSAETEEGLTYEYRLWCSRTATNALAPFSSKVSVISVIKQTRAERRVVGDYLLIKIKDISVEPKTTSVHNLEVASEHHSYIVNGVATHNCGVPYDICTMCGNHAQTKKDYCDHLKYQKMSLSKEGHQAAAINDQPHLHDISEVRVPAFRAAYALSKVASEGSLPSQDDPNALWLPLSMIGEIGDKLEQKHAAAFSKAAEIEKKILAKGMSPEESGLAEAFQDNHIGEETIKELQQYPVGDVLAALSERGVLLPPGPFCRIALKRPESEINNAKDLPCCIKKVFSELADSGDNEVFSDSSYVPLSPRHWTGLEESADKLVAGHSAEDGPVSKRIIQISIKGGPSLSKRASLLVTPTQSAESRYLAKEYAKYQVAFMAGLGVDKYAHRVIVHNQVTT